MNSLFSQPFRAVVSFAAITVVSVIVMSAFFVMSVQPAEAKLKKPRRWPNHVISVMVGEAQWQDDQGAVVENHFTSEGRVQVETEAGERLFYARPGVDIYISYDNGVYTARRSGGNSDKIVTSNEPLRVTPMRRGKTVTAETLDKRPAWNLELNDNYFYGSVEVVYSENSNALLLVNHLGIERYISGISEATNDNDPEYLKALLTAARTYALWHVLHPTKHADEPYLLNATDGDQVYKGAGFSDRAPNVVAAQRATKKQVITYGGEPIIAAYFSQSDGRTRSWSEVWGGDYPYAQSVDDPCCDGEELLGHGVGMSAAGARLFAEDYDWTFDQILKYYYTGVEVEEGY